MLATLWRVDDDASAVLLERCYRYLSQGRTTAEALRLAQLDLIASGRHPFYWAAYQLFGDSR